MGFKNIATLIKNLREEIKEVIIVKKTKTLLRNCIDNRNIKTRERRKGGSSALSTLRRDS